MKPLRVGPDCNPKTNWIGGRMDTIIMPGPYAQSLFGFKLSHFFVWSGWERSSPLGTAATNWRSVPVRDE
jgi:hypothetical protein